jgi:hypothetical protein
MVMPSGANVDTSLVGKITIIAKVIEVNIIRGLAYDVWEGRFRDSIAVVKVVIVTALCHNLKVMVSMDIIKIEVMVDHQS